MHHNPRENYLARLLFQIFNFSPCIFFYLIDRNFKALLLQISRKSPEIPGTAWSQTGRWGAIFRARLDLAEKWVGRRGSPSACYWRRSSAKYIRDEQERSQRALSSQPAPCAPQPFRGDALPSSRLCSSATRRPSWTKEGCCSWNRVLIALSTRELCWRVEGSHELFLVTDKRIFCFLSIRILLILSCNPRPCFFPQKNLIIISSVMQSFVTHTE